MTFRSQSRYTNRSHYNLGKRMTTFHQNAAKTQHSLPSLQVQRDASRLICESCNPTQPHPMNPTQLKLLIVLAIHGSLWIHGKTFAETYIVDCMWHITQALHSCQVSDWEYILLRAFTHVEIVRRNFVPVEGSCLAESFLPIRHVKAEHSKV